MADAAPHSVHEPLRYEHKSLPKGKWIRVAALQPFHKSRSERIHFDFEQVQLDEVDHRAYVAISYSWSKQIPTETVTCEDQDLLITPTLLSALRSLRGAADIVHVWADAICIDQSEAGLSELESQVAMMEYVFSAASCMYVHLGEFSSDDLEIVDTLKIFSTLEYKTVQDKFNSFVEIYDDITQTLRHYKLPNVDSEVWTRFDRFMARDWFTRLWIIQEYAAASKVIFMFGEDLQMTASAVENGIIKAATYYSVTCAPLIQKSISTGYTFAETIALWIPRFSLQLGWYTPIDRIQRSLVRFAALQYRTQLFIKICSLRRRYQENQQYKAPQRIVTRYATAVGFRNLWQLLDDQNWWRYRKHVFFKYYVDTRHFAATLHHDRIFALRGILTEGRLLAFDVNYGQSKKELAEDITLHLIERGHAVLMLTTYSLAAQPGKNGWRCFLGNLNNTADKMALNSFIQPSGAFRNGLFRAGGYEPDIKILPKPSSSSSTAGKPRQLSVAGVCIGQIDDICPIEYPTLIRDEMRAISWQSANWREGMKRQIQWYADAKTWLDEMQNWMFNSKHNDDDNEDFDLDCWRTLSCGLTLNSMGQPELISKLGSSHSGALPPRGLASRDPALVTRQCQDAYSSLWSLATRYLFYNVALPWENFIMSAGRQLATDNAGRPCAIPVGSKVGDRVVLLRGFPLPFIVRPTDEEKEDTSFLLIGACYVHGVEDETLFEQVYSRHGTRFVLESGPVDNTEGDK